MTMPISPSPKTAALLAASDLAACFVEACGVAGDEIQARCDRAETAAWLAKSMGVWRLDAPCAAPCATVIQIGRPEILASCRALLAQLPVDQAAGIDWYMQRRAWCWTLADGTRVIKPQPDERSAPDRGVYPIHVIDPDECYIQSGDHIYVFSGAEHCVEFSRVVREILTKRALLDGWVLLRASAVGAPAGAIAFCGPKSVGKTTLLLGTLDAKPVDYLANGRLLIREADTGIEAIGIPIVAGLRGPTVRAYPKMFTALLEQRLALSYPQQAWWLEDFVAGEQLGHKVGLLPQELAGLFARRVLPSAPLGQIVLLERAEGSAEAGKISAEALSEALADELLEVEGVYFPDVFGVGVPSPEAYAATAHAVFARMGRSVDAIRVRGDRTTDFVLDHLDVRGDAPPRVAVRAADHLEELQHV